MRDLLRERNLFIVAAALLVGAALAARWPALDPKTLWYDDVWVAAFASAASLRQALGAAIPTPPGFLLLVRASLALVGDPEIGAQIAPLLGGLALIPLVGWIVARLTRSWVGGIAAASLVALDPRLSEQTIHVKQYSVEALVVTLLLAGLVLAGERPGAARLVWLPIAAAAALPLMVSGNIAAVLLVNAVVAVVAWNEGGVRRRRILLCGAAFDATAALLAVVVFLPRRTDSLAGYWDIHFLPLGSWGEALRFLRTIVPGTLTGAAPVGMAWLALLAVPGIVWLLRGERAARLMGAFALLLWAAMVAASALRIHPVGSRADTFADGVVVTIFGVGLVALWRLLSPRMAAACAAAAAVALFGLAVWEPPSPPYFDSALSMRVHGLFEEIRPEDGLIIYPESSWLVAYYSGRPIVFDVADLDGSLTSLPVARIDRPGSLSLPLADPEVVRRRLDDFVVRGRFERIFYFGSRQHLQLPEAPLFELLAARGYRIEEDRRSMLFTPGARRQDAGVVTFVRDRGPFSGEPGHPE